MGSPHRYDLVVGVSTIPRPTLALVTFYHGGLGLAGVYSGEYMDESVCTAWMAVTCATRPVEDVPARLVMTFLGERTPVVGRTRLSAQERTMAHAPGPWAALSIEPGDARPRGEANQPPLGRPA